MRAWPLPPLSDEVVTPDVVGMVVDEARKVAQAAGVVLAQPDPEGPPLSELTWRLPMTVTAQDPPPGTFFGTATSSLRDQVPQNRCRPEAQRSLTRRAVHCLKTPPQRLEAA